MPQISTPLYAELGVAALLLLLLAVRPSITRSPEGKILAAVALLVTPAFAAYAGVSEHMERARSTAYCLSCHVMSDYGRSMRVDDPDFLAATHFQNGLVPRDRACISCHSDYGWSGNLRAKARGFKHVMETYFGSVPDTIRISRRYRGRECLRCHLGSRPFEESFTHLAGPVPMADIKSGKASCLRSGCHDLVHEVHELDQMAFWNPMDPPIEEARAAWERSERTAAPAVSTAAPAARADSATVTPEGDLR